MDVHSPLFRLIARLLIGVLFLNPLLSTAAELAVDASAGSNTQITAAANGVPIVNIATPTAGGLSHNKFTDYNVGQQGLILNNATGHFNDTQLGGVIFGNSNLHGQAAGLILNEITGSNPSELKGYTEVAGQAAQVVVANPYGITCDGCGFINTPRVTLSTGTPVIAEGQIKHFSVEDGQIVFDGAGMNAANISQFELITRATHLNAEIYAQRLSIITGRNDVDAETLAAMPKADDGRARPGVSIDSSALGGMYAGAIRLVGTEAGVGVRASADMAASADDVEIDINGKLTVLRAASGKDLRVKAEAVEFLDRVHADGDVQITATGSVEVGKSLTSAGNVVVSAGSFINQGTVGGAGSVRLTAAELLNQNGLIFSGQDMVLVAERFTNRLADIQSLGSLTLTASEHLDNRSASIESAGDMSLRAERLSNRKEVLRTEKTQTQGQVEVVCHDCSGDHHNVDYLATETFTTDVLEDSAAARISSGGKLDIQVGTLSNQASSISASGALNITGNSLENLGVTTGTVQRERRFNTGRVTDGTDQRFRAAYVDPYNAQGFPKQLPDAFNGWTLVSDTQTQLATGLAAPAIIQAGGDVTLQASQPITNAAVIAHQQPGEATQLNPQQVADLTRPGNSTTGDGLGGLFQVAPPGQRYVVESNPAFASLRGFISSDYLLSRIGYDPDQIQRRLGDGLYEQRLVQQAIVARTGKRFLDGLSSDEAQFRNLMDNAIASKQALNLVPGIALSAAQVAALTHDIVWMQEQEVGGEKVLVPVLYLAQVKDRLAPTGALIQGRDLTLITGSSLSNSGTLRASQNLTASAAAIGNSGLIQADRQLSLLAIGDISNSHGGVISGQDVSLTSVLGDISNQRTITTQSHSGPNFSHTSSEFDNAAAIEAGRDLTLSSGGSIANIGGRLQAGGKAELKAEGDVIIAAAQAQSGQMRRDKRHDWETASTSQYGSEVTTGTDLRISAGNDLDVAASTLKAGRAIQLDAANDITLSAAANSASSEYRYNGNGKKVTQENSTVRQQATVIEAGGDLGIDAGHNLIARASHLKAANEAYLYAGDQLALLSAEDSDHSLYDKKKKGSFGAKESRKDETTTVRQIGTRIESGGDLSLISEGNQHYQKASLHSGGDLTLDSGGAIAFEAVKDLDQQSHERSKNSWVWTSTKGEGHTDETLRQSELIAKGETIIRAVDGLHIDIKQIDQHSVSQTIDAMVAADPSLAWLKDAEKRGDVNWRQVKELHDAFQYESSGLGMGAVLVIAIVVTVLTAGTASSVIGSLAGVEAGSGAAMAAGAGATAAGFGNVAATATVTSMTSTATVSTINNKGHLAAIGKDVFSAESLKGYLTAALIAGVGANTDTWGTKTVEEGNLAVLDFNKRVSAYLVNTALKGALTDGKDSKNWFSIAGTGALAEIYKYSVGREPDIKPGLDRVDGPKLNELEGNFIPRIIVDGVYREGKNLGLNWPFADACAKWYAICHGTPISDAINSIPGTNSFATLHDSWMISLEFLKGQHMSVLENIGTMPPAAVINYGAVYEKYRQQIELARSLKNEK